MPEVEDFRLWATRKWVNVNEDSGTRLQERPYYYKVSEDKTKMLLISAVDRPGFLKATDFLQLDRKAFKELEAIVKSELRSTECESSYFPITA